MKVFPFEKGFEVGSDFSLALSLPFFPGGRGLQSKNEVLRHMGMERIVGEKMKEGKCRTSFSFRGKKAGSGLRTEMEVISAAAGKRT